MSSSELAITARELGKAYRILTADDRPTTVGEAVMERIRRPLHRRSKTTLWALRDASFDVRRGEVVGVIGANGAGKTTLLKLLSRITDPSRGEARLFGRVGSLLEVGTGFHPELTGRENVFLNGSILGMKRREVARRFDEIVDFSGVSEFLDTPVKRYSSGMQVRLAFAVAAHLEPEILVVDEVLAVGDAEFQKKCLGKIGDVASQEGRTVMFVSHNMAAMESLCPRALYLEAGQIEFDGDTDDAIRRYLARSSRPEADTRPGEFDLAASRPDTESPILRKLTIQDSRGVSTDAIRMGESLSLIIDVEGFAEINDAHVAVRIRSELDQMLASVSTRMVPPQFTDAREVREHVILTIPHLPLLPAHYWIELDVKTSKKVVDKVERAGDFTIVAADVYGTGYAADSKLGVLFVEPRWEVRAGESTASPTTAHA